jgi:hypothetical protein
MLRLMPLAFLLSHHPQRWPISESAGIGLIISVLTIFAVILRILQLDEAASDRVQIIILVIGWSAFLAVLITAILVGRFASGWSRSLRAILASIFCCVLFIPIVMIIFAFENRIIEGNLEPNAYEIGRLSELFWSIIGAMGLFTPTGMRYLMPWPLLLLGLSAALIFYVWPSKRNTDV